MRVFFFLLSVYLLSCCCNNELADKLNELRQLGDVDPMKAMSQLNSLEKFSSSSSNYNQNKLRLLRIRLNDKADFIATSDKEIRDLVAYFQIHGTDRDRQEAYYYAGSVYRDLMDTPRSIDFFLRSTEFEENESVDSVMLRNSYSQLSNIYSRVQDYKSALWAADKECEIASKLGILDNLSKIHRVEALFRLTPDSTLNYLMDEILEEELQADEESKNYSIIEELLYTYSYLKNKANATKCFNLLLEHNALSKTNFLATAEYYSLVGNIDSCICCCERALYSDDLETKYDASNHLFRIYTTLGDKDLALKYARIFQDISAELNLGKRQNLAATVNNQYKYYRDKHEEEKIKEERRMFALLAWAIGIVCVFILISSFAITSYQKYKRTKRLLGIADSLKITNKLKRQKEQELFNEEKLVAAINQNIIENKLEKERVEQELHKTTEYIAELTNSLVAVKSECEAKEKALKETENELQKNKAQLHNTINNITIIDLQLQRSEQELREKTILLEEKLKQNESLFRMLHQSDLQGAANAIIDSIKKAAIGETHLSDDAWKQFITAVDNLYPNYHKEIISILGTLKTDQLRVCYLLKAGLTNTQIQNLITDVSRATIWRWIKRYNSLLSGTINSL